MRQVNSSDTLKNTSNWVIASRIWLHQYMGHILKAWWQRKETFSKSDLKSSSWSGPSWGRNKGMECRLCLGLTRPWVSISEPLYGPIYYITIRRFCCIFYSCFVLYRVFKSLFTILKCINKGNRLVILDLLYCTQFVWDYVQSNYWSIFLPQEINYCRCLLWLFDWRNDTITFADHWIGREGPWPCS